MLASVLGLQKHPSSRGMYGCLRAVAAISVLLGDNTDDFARFAPFPCVLLSMPPPAQGRGSDKVSLGPRPSRDSRTKEGLVSNVGILDCAESACL